MIKLHFLPARYGDAIWIEYGDDTQTHRILIDGGTRGTRHNITKLLNSLPEEERKFELLVVTHIDRDHIEGILGLLEEEELPFKVDDFWFNGWNHLPGNSDDEHFGAVQGERLTACILKHKLPWNKEFSGKTVKVPDEGALTVIDLPGGMKLTLLSPDKEKLADLKEDWEKEVRDANLDPGFGLDVIDEEESDDESFTAVDLPEVETLVLKEFHEDEAAGNGSSIAFLAEFDGKKILFSGDAHPTLMLKNINRLSPDAPLEVDLYKVSHHGSSHNTNDEILEKIKTGKYVFSTNGSIFKHPTQVTVARVIKAADNPQLIFNYKKKTNDIWDLQFLKDQHGYSTMYPDDGSEGVIVEL